MSETTYNEYPITLAHPHFTPSKPVPVPGTEIRDAHGQITGYRAYHGTPERYPPVTAMNADMEERLKADGYERAGKIDPAAWVAAHADAPLDNYKPAQYPKWAKDADGNPVLYQTAADDPDARVEDLAAASEPEKAEAAPSAPSAPSELENMRAQMAQMNELMQRMQEQTLQAQHQAAEATARLAEAARAATQAPTAQTARRGPGRPRKAA